MAVMFLYIGGCRLINLQRRRLEPLRTSFRADVMLFIRSADFECDASEGPLKRHTNNFTIMR